MKYLNQSECDDLISSFLTEKLHLVPYNLYKDVELDWNHKLHDVPSPACDQATRLHHPRNDTNENELVRGKNILKCVQMDLET